MLELIEILIIATLIIGAVLIDRYFAIKLFKADITQRIVETHNYTIPHQILDTFIPKTTKLLFSFRALKIENWYSIKEIDDLFNNN